MWKSQFRGGVIPSNNGSKCNRDGEASWSRGHHILARVLDVTSWNTDGKSSIRPFHVVPEVVQSDSWTRGEKKGKEPDEEGRAGIIILGNV